MKSNLRFEPEDHKMTERPYGLTTWHDPKDAEVE